MKELGVGYPPRAAGQTHRPMVSVRLLYALYPLVLVLALCLGVYSANLGYVPARDILWPILVALGAVAIVQVLCSFLLGSLQKGAMAAFALVLLGIMFRLLVDILPWFWSALILGLICVLLFHTIYPLLNLTITSVFLCFASVAMLIFPTARIITYSPPPTLPLPGLLPATGGTADFYYIILDGYSGLPDLLERGYDNGPFYSRLETLGFDTLPDSQSQYSQTELCLASQLNLCEVEGDPRQLVPLIQNSALARTLQSLGYVTMNIGGHWWGITSRNPYADINLRSTGLSEYASTLLDHTPWYVISGTAATARRQQTLAQLSALSSSPADGSPRFTFCHLLCPHEPFVFAADGSDTGHPLVSQRNREEAYLAQLTWISTAIEGAISDIIEGQAELGRETIILLQADHGYDGNNSALNAVYLPCEWEPPEHPTQRNTLATVWEACFNREAE